MKVIESVNNQYIKYLSSLHEKKYRDIEKKFLIEGEHLVNEAYKTKHLTAVLFSDEKYRLDGVINIKVSEEIIKKLTTTINPQKVVGVCDFLKPKKERASKYLLLDNISDPGNLGTIVRSALGFNIDKIYLSKYSVDLYNEKFIRATQGAIFYIDIEVVEIFDKINELKAEDIEVFGTALDSSVILEDVNVPEKYAIILGNEAQGVDQDILKIATRNIYIKTNPFLESLNVAVAGSIILYYFNSKSPI